MGPHNDTAPLYRAETTNGVATSECLSVSNLEVSMPEEDALTQTASSLIDEGEVYEIFQQDQRDPLPHHGGNLRAADAELAIHYAREFYGRRQESLKLWIIPRSALLELRNQTPLPAMTALFGNNIESGPKPQTYAVFGQKHPGHPLLWLQDLEASEIDEVTLNHIQSMADGIIRLWLCPRQAILQLDNQDLLQPPLDRSYRRLDGYNIREKLRIARERVRAQRGAS